MNKLKVKEIDELLELYSGEEDKHIGFCLSEYDEMVCQYCPVHDDCLKLFEKEDKQQTKLYKEG